MWANVVFSFDDITGQTIKITSVRPKFAENGTDGVPVYSVTQDYSHFRILPNLKIKLNSFEDFNKSARSFIKPAAHIT